VKVGAVKEEEVDEFARSAIDAFGDLLWEPEELIGRMRCIGEDPSEGDGILALPTMVHRGPGGGYDNITQRVVLFFTVQPIYSKDDKVVGTYDPKAQIHAGWLVWRAYNEINEVDRTRIFQAYSRLGFELNSFGKGGKIFWEDPDGPVSKKKKKNKAKEGPKEGAQEGAKEGAKEGAQEASGGKAVKELAVQQMMEIEAGAVDRGGGSEGEASEDFDTMDAEHFDDGNEQESV